MKKRTINFLFVLAIIFLCLTFFWYLCYITRGIQQVVIYSTIEDKFINGERSYFLNQSWFYLICNVFFISFSTFFYILAIKYLKAWRRKKLNIALIKGKGGCK